MGYNTMKWLIKDLLHHEARHEYIYNLENAAEN